MANTDPTTITPERLLLSAILRTMKPARREMVLVLVGDTTADNIVRMRAPHDQVERNRLIGEARRIAGEA